MVDITESKVNNKIIVLLLILDISILPILVLNFMLQIWKTKYNHTAPGKLEIIRSNRISTAIIKAAE
jgi:hypothetical protein